MLTGGTIWLPAMCALRQQAGKRQVRPENWFEFTAKRITPKAKKGLIEKIWPDN
jgi:hypothetical protein